MRTLAYQFIKVDIGNGKKAFFWHDNWLRIGRLIDLTGATGTRYLGVTRNARVHDAVSSGQWSVRGQRSQNFKELHQMIQAEPVPSIELGEDTYLWKHEHDFYEEKFSAVRTWDLIRFQNRLSTGDRMRAWGVQQGCILCGERDETRDHLFFACPYSYTVWDRLASRLVGRRINPDWLDMFQFIQTGSSNQLTPSLSDCGVLCLEREEQLHSPKRAVGDRAADYSNYQSG
ncbi:PREDICTED: uncharacterized protein LOC106302669 [Brassica oleracea var. oleracea]|uniref:uncharacterized protein LOC106302669 n=1 Tax=Brassica oleracea var. oleracea TaxID=109376 RepID=UPI0006A70A66|nr:PREDICTED: uncharacterized protein LOC106302669 [Brassica oleracea var. oleracea]